MNFNTHHTFHIPVLGIGYTIDSPVKVAPYGISSTLSLADDILIEKMRAFYCNKYNWDFTPIDKTTDDFRAKRITAYLDLLHDVVKLRFKELKEILSEDKKAFQEYLSMFPGEPENMTDPEEFVNNFNNKQEIADWIEKNVPCGNIDVNIMTKLDKPNYIKNEKLSPKYNDAHAALRGFANSKLSASVVFSAGFNLSLFSSIENFAGFFPDKNGITKKKIIIKVSDYRSALVHGKFFAKRGLWISEYRIESGLNCGGHLFPTQGYLMGPILEEFQLKRNELHSITTELYIDTLKQKSIEVDEKKLNIRISAQGGVTTAMEHRFMLDYYNLDSVGWGTPFLLVPEVTNVDEKTRELLKAAKKEDVYISSISPLNVLFSNLKQNTQDQEKELRIAQGIPGSTCPKKYLALNTEFTKKEVCIASRQYQALKIEELQEQNLPADDYNSAYKNIVDKACICVGLGTAALLVNNLDTKVEGNGVSICPGPNIAFFNKTYSLKEMVQHIYNKKAIVTNQIATHTFIRELELYIQFIKDKISSTPEPSQKQSAYFKGFIDNLNSGINYYKTLFSEYTFPNVLKILMNLELELATVKS